MTYWCNSLLILWLAAGSACDSQPQAPKRQKLIDASFTPRAATLHFAIDPAADGFSGWVEYSLSVTKPGNALRFDSIDLRILDARIGESQLDIAVGERELRVSKSSGRFTVGEAKVRIAFAGQFRDKDGVFMQSIANQRFVYTDFEPEDARRAFPCVDQPKLKLPWTVSIRAPRGMTVLANGEAKRVERDKDNTQLVEFAPTAPIPSYLVAFAVGNFRVDQVATPRGPIRFYIPPGARVNDAKSVAPAALAAVEEYFASEVPFTKLDFVAVPTFKGAMENPGLITVSLGILADRPGLETRAHRNLRRTVIVHELVHMWIGNSVTIERWQDAWWQEGLPTWLTAHLLHRLYPDRGFDEAPLTDRYHALLFALGPEAMAMRPAADVVTDKNKLFSPITYGFAASLFWRMEKRLGAATMQQAARSIVAAKKPHITLNKWLHAAAVTDADRRLWREWMGRPQLAMLTPQITCTDKGGRIGLGRSRVTHRGLEPKPAPGNHCFSYGDANSIGGEFCLSMRTSDVTYEVPGVCPTWVLPMPQEPLLPNIRTRMIADAHKAGAIDKVQRINLTHATTALTWIHAVPLKSAFSRIETLAVDGSDAWLAASIPALERLATVAKARNQPKRLAVFLRDSFGKRMSALGIRGGKRDTEITHTIRDEFLATYVTAAGDTQLIVEARKLFLAVGKGRVSASLWELLSIASIAAPTLAEAAWNQWRTQAYKARSVAHHLMLAQAVAARAEPEVVNEFLDELPQHDNTIAAMLGATPRGRLALQAVEARRPALTPAINASLKEVLVCDAPSLRYLNKRLSPTHLAWGKRCVKRPSRR